MARIDLPTTIGNVTFPDRIWEWLDLLGDAIRATEQEAEDHETFLADNDLKKLLVRSLNREIADLRAIYVLLRCELIHQAAAHVRLICEGVITLGYVIRNPEARVCAFLDYGKIEAYEMAVSLLKWEESKARADHVARLQKLRLELEPEYTRLKPKFMFRNAKGKERPFSNWCNKRISEQAKGCGEEMERLYALVYKQMSAYVHGSGWSLRRQLAYSRKYYDEKVVLNDVATIVRTTLAVWIELAKFCDERMEWHLVETAWKVAEACESLDTKHFLSATE